MHERPSCLHPLVPCAMSGAAACLAGFEDCGVVIHGSSGCYFYTASIMDVAIHGTCLLEDDLIFGAERRLREVVEQIQSRYSRVVVVNTCVPAVVGEDLRSIAPDGLIVIDSPGFVGDFEEGYSRALQALGPRVADGTRGVNIDGLNPVDPFYRGNWLEARRLLALAGSPVGIGIATGRIGDLQRAGPLTVGTNPALASGVGRSIGTLLGLAETERAFRTLADSIPDLDAEAVAAEVSRAAERIDYACDKYLRRFDPPRVGIFASHAYAAFAAEQLGRHLDAEIVCVGPRSRPTGSALPVVRDLAAVREMLDGATPDLVLGSAYEQSLAPQAAFVTLAPPVRDRVQLRARAIVGTEGALSFVEDVLNACRDRAGRGTTKH